MRGHGHCASHTQVVCTSTVVDAGQFGVELICSKGASRASRETRCVRALLSVCLSSSCPGVIKKGRAEKLCCRRAWTQCGMAKRSKLFINFFKHVPEVPGH